jgi:hypothetical protein
VAVGATKIYLSVNLYTLAIFKMSNHPEDPLLFLQSRVGPLHPCTVCFYSVLLKFMRVVIQVDVSFSFLLAF